MRSISSSFFALALALSVAQATPSMSMPPSRLRVKRQNDHSAPQSGDLTFYNTGMTSCGVVKSDSDKIAAVSMLFYDTYPGATANPNLNPVCGQKATITNPANGKSVVVEVYDRCTGCAFGDIDITPAAFDEIADPNDGRISVTWQLGEGAPETSPPPPPPPPPPETQAPPPPQTTSPEEDPCPPEETQPPQTEDPCPPEEPEPPQTEDPCVPEGDGEGEGEGETTTSPPPPPPPPSGNGGSGAWDASKVYVGGDQACKDGTLYKAKWWTQNEAPPTDVWENVGSC